VTDKTIAGAAGQHPNFRRVGATAALLWLWLLAGAVVAFTLAIPRAFQAWGDHGYMAFALATGLAALVATGVAERSRPTHALWLIIGVAILLRAILLVMDPLLSTDIYRYIWDGRVQAAGFNPYRFVPAHEALSALRDTAIYPNINRADYAVSIYPPVAQAFFYVVTRIGETVTIMKLAFLACEGVTVAAIAVLLRRTGRSATRLVAYLWHPLPLWEIANNGHIDALMVALMMVGLLLAFAGRPLTGAGAIALGALAKPTALLALPVLWRPPDWKMPLVVGATIVLCYVPYLSVGWGALGFLGQGYLSEEGFSSGGSVWPLQVWRWIAGTRAVDVTAYFAVAAIVVVAFALRTALLRQRAIATQLADINSLFLLGLFVLSPNYPWYFLVATPFIALCGGAPGWAMTLGALMLQEEAGWGQFVPLLIRKSLFCGAFLAACAWSFWSASRQSPTNNKDGGVDAR
jgi:hypothetical protein